MQEPEVEPIQETEAEPVEESEVEPIEEPEVEPFEESEEVAVRDLNSLEVCFLFVSAAYDKIVVAHLGSVVFLGFFGFHHHAPSRNVFISLLNFLCNWSKINKV